MHRHLANNPPAAISAPSPYEGKAEPVTSQGTTVNDVLGMRPGTKKAAALRGGGEV
jgi:hypothetical protein